MAWVLYGILAVVLIGVFRHDLITLVVISYIVATALTFTTSSPARAAVYRIVRNFHEKVFELCLQIASKLRSNK